MRAESIAEEYARLAPVYDRRYSAYLQRSHDAVLDLLGATAGGTLLDAGCGTGRLLGEVARHAPALQLHGFDRSPEMLDQARQRLGAGRSLGLADSAALPLADESFDFVVSASSLHYQVDKLAALREFHRVLKPGGRLLLTDWDGDALTIRWMTKWLSWQGRGGTRVPGRREVERHVQGAGLTLEHSRAYRAGATWVMFLLCAGKPGPGGAGTTSGGGAGGV